MARITLTVGPSFVAEAGMTILDAAMRAGTPLPYSCKAGRCSTCRCKIIRGSTTAVLPESGLTDAEKSDGWILSCARTADADLLVEIESFGDLVLPPIKTLPCRIHRIERLAPDVIEVHLRLPPSAAFGFLPGQHVSVIGPNGIRRSYSLANANSPDRLLKLHIRAVDGGAMSRYWFHQAQVNDLLRLSGPLGTFFLRDTTNADLIFLATGTGMAPVKAMLESIASLPDDRRPQSINVVWGGRRPQDHYLDVAGIPGRHRYLPVLSQAGPGWTGARGHVQDALLALAPDLRNASVYACGSESMIRDARAALVLAGLPASRFHSDAFVSSEPDQSNQSH